MPVLLERPLQPSFSLDIHDENIQGSRGCRNSDKSGTYSFLNEDKCLSEMLSIQVQPSPQPQVQTPQVQPSLQVQPSNTSEQLNKLTVVQLKDMLRAKGLKIPKLKAEMVKSLLEAGSVPSEEKKTVIKPIEALIQEPSETPTPISSNVNQPITPQEFSDVRSKIRFPEQTEIPIIVTPENVDKV